MALVNGTPSSDERPATLDAARKMLAGLWTGLACPRPAHVRRYAHICDMYDTDADMSVAQHHGSTRASPAQAMNA
eukprot:scaffold225_cov388-Prasinococcus_capsulatus_cf.AAC.20